MRILTITRTAVIATLIGLAPGIPAYTANSIGQARFVRQLSDSVAVLHVVETLMTAARTGDNVTIAQRSRGDQPQR